MPIFCRNLQMIKDILKNLFHVSTYLEQDTNERI